MKTFKQLKVGDNIYVWDYINQHIIITEITNIKKKWKYRQFTMKIILGVESYTGASLTLDRKSCKQFNVHRLSKESDTGYYISTDFDYNISVLIKLSNEIHNSVNRGS